MYHRSVEDIRAIPAYAWGLGCNLAYSLQQPRTKRFEKLDLVDYFHTNLNQHSSSYEFMRKVSKLYSKYNSNRKQNLILRNSAKAELDTSVNTEPNKTLSSQKLATFSKFSGKRFSFSWDSYIQTEDEDDVKDLTQSQSEDDQPLKVNNEVDPTDTNRLRFRLNNVNCTLKNLQDIVYQEIVAEGRDDGTLQSMFFSLSYITRFAIPTPAAIDVQKTHLQRLTEWLFYYHNSCKAGQKKKDNNNNLSLNESNPIQEVSRHMLELLTSGRILQLHRFLDKFLKGMAKELSQRCRDAVDLESLELIQQILKVVGYKKYYFQGPEAPDEERQREINYFKAYKEDLQQNMNNLAFMDRCRNDKKLASSNLCLIAKMLYGDSESALKLSNGDWRVYLAFYILFCQPFASMKNLVHEIHKFQNLYNNISGNNIKLFESLIEEEYHMFVQQSFNYLPPQFAVTVALLLDELHLLPQQTHIKYLDDLSYKQYLLKSVGNWMLEVDSDDAFKIVRPYLKMYVRQFDKQGEELLDLVISSKFKIQPIDTPVKYSLMIRLCSQIIKIGASARLRSLLKALTMFQAKQECFEYLFDMALLYSNLFPSDIKEVFSGIKNCLISNIQDSSQALAFNYSSFLERLRSSSNKEPVTSELLTLKHTFKMLMEFSQIVTKKNSIEERCAFMQHFLEESGEQEVRLMKQIVEVVRGIVEEQGHKKSTRLIFRLKMFATRARQRQLVADDRYASEADRMFLIE